MTRAVLDSGWLIDTPIMDQLFKAIQLVLKEPQQGRSPAHEKDTKTFQEILYDTPWMSWASWWQLEGRSNLEVVIINNGALHHWYVLAPDNQASYACLATSVHPKFIYATLDWFLKANGKQSCRTYHSPEVYPKLLEKWMINEEEFKKALANYIEGDPKDFISDLEEVKIEAQRHDAANSLAPDLIPILQAMPDNKYVTIERKAVAISLWKEVVQYHIYRKYQDRLTELLETLKGYPKKHLSKGWHEEKHEALILSINSYLDKNSSKEDTLEGIIGELRTYGEIDHNEKASWFRFWRPKLPCSTAKELQEEMQALYSKLWPKPLDATYKELKRNTNSQAEGRPRAALAPTSSSIN